MCDFVGRVLNFCITESDTVWVATEPKAYGNITGEPITKNY